MLARCVCVCVLSSELLSHGRHGLLTLVNLIIVSLVVVVYDMVWNDMVWYGTVRVDHNADGHAR